MTFAEVIGQEAVAKRLKAMVDEGRIPNAVMLCGSQGVGKLALAVALATYILGEKEAIDNPSSDHARHQMAMLAKYEHPDLLFTYPTVKPQGWPSEKQPVSDDFAAQWHELVSSGFYFFFNEWLESIKAENKQAIITAKESDELSRKLSLKSSQGGYKVSVIWLPERMNQASANKMLKILEEPPEKTLFILVSEEPEKLLETIRSRTQRIDVPRVDTAAIERELIARRGLDQDAAHRLARISNGSWTKALQLLDANDENKQFLSLFITFMRNAYGRRVSDLKQWSDDLALEGRETQRRFLLYTGRMIRESFIYNFHIEELSYMTQEEEDFCKRFSPFINEANIIEITELLQRCYRDIGQNANSKMVFFDLALKMIVLLRKK